MLWFVKFVLDLGTSHTYKRSGRGIMHHIHYLINKQNEGKKPHPILTQALNVELLTLVVVTFAKRMMMRRK